MGEKQVLTDELRKQLAGFFPFSNEATTEHTPEFFLEKKLVKIDENEHLVWGEYKIPEEYRPVFTVRCFKKDEYDAAHKLMQEERNDKDHLHTVDRLPKIKDSIRKVVSGWINYWDIGKMEQIPFVADTVEGAHKDLWEKVPDSIIMDLQDFVYKLSGLRKADHLSLK